MSNSKNTKLNKTLHSSHCGGACNCENCTCGCQKDACTCQESGCQCGCAKPGKRQ
jgi:hypothetical protein